MPSSFILGEKRYAEADLDTLCAAPAAALGAQSSLIVHASDQLAFLAALRMGASAGCTVLAAPSYWARAEVDAEAQRRCATAELKTLAGTEELVLEPRGTNVQHAAEPGVVLFSSGTTGVPKAISHSWATASASAGFVPERLFERTWYLAYEPAAYAGLQVFYSAARSHGTLVLPAPGASFRAHAESIVAHRADVVSATPSWWRLLVSAWPATLPAPRLHQVTMGGEVVDQPTLDLVDGFFKPTHLTHVYASSEVGSAVAVSDRQAGFPARLLDAPRPVMLRVRSGVLEVRSPFRMRRYLDSDDGGAHAEGWIRTGDVVEVREGRCYFVGREDQRLNVGGTKVAPEQIESVVLSHPDVRECVVYGRRSPIVGILLALDVVAADPLELDVRQLRGWLEQQLPQHLVPKHIRLVREIGLSLSGKKQRP
jgi:acyl-coenzyme A synthetase/AMP-(fatty) acid ligase